jgi:L-alanine-DL-glutamate epimerase-like enolase superfamily enzyme
VELRVDANGAYTRKQALAFAEAFAAEHVRWFEEPVSSDDLPGLALLCKRAPAGMSIAAGEYVYDLFDAQRLLRGRAVDVLQVDATRALGITGFLKACTLCEANALPVSAHTAPLVHLHPACAARPVQDIEYFHDHVRIDSILFDGVPEPRAGRLSPCWDRPGLGLDLKRADAEQYAVSGRLA